MVAKGLDWPVADVRETQYGAVMLNLDQNLGAFGVGDGKPVCQSLPEGAPDPETGASGWGDMLFGGQPDCASGYLADTWDLFGEVYMEAGVIESFASSEEGVDLSILEALDNDGATEAYSSNAWIGRVGL